MPQSKLSNALAAVSSCAGILMIAVGCPTLLVWRQDPTATFALLIVGVVAVFVGRLHLIEEIGLWGLRARLRASIDEANATVQQLRSVALALGEASLTDLMAGNFMDSMSLRQRFSVQELVVKSLRDLGLSEKEVQEASANWNKGICLTYAYTIGTALPKDVGPETRTAFGELGNFKEWQAPTPAEVEAFLEERNLLNDGIAEWIDDYRHFVRTKQIRRKDEFLASRE